MTQGDFAEAKRLQIPFILLTRNRISQEEDIRGEFCSSWGDDPFGYLGSRKPPS